LGRQNILQQQETADKLNLLALEDTDSQADKSTISIEVQPYNPAAATQQWAAEASKWGDLGIASAEEATAPSLPEVIQSKSNFGGACKDWDFDAVETDDLEYPEQRATGDLSLQRRSHIYSSIPHAADVPPARGTSDMPERRGASTDVPPARGTSSDSTKWRIPVGGTCPYKADPISPAVSPTQKTTDTTPDGRGVQFADTPRREYPQRNSPRRENYSHHSPPREECRRPPEREAPRSYSPPIRSDFASRPHREPADNYSSPTSDELDRPPEREAQRHHGSPTRGEFDRPPRREAPRYDSAPSREATYSHRSPTRRRHDSPPRREAPRLDSPQEARHHSPARPAVAAGALPKLIIPPYNGNALAWPKWSGLFWSTVGRSTMTDDEKMIRLKSSLTGKAETAISNLDYDGRYFQEAWNILKRKFGQAHVLVGAQLEGLQAYQAVRMHSSEAIVAYATFVEGFVHTLQVQGYESDLRSVSNLNIAVGKLPPDLSTDWYKSFTTKRIQQPTLNDFAEWLTEVSLAHERILASKPTTSHQNTTQQQQHSQANRPRGNQPYNSNSQPRIYPQQRYQGNTGPYKPTTGFLATANQRTTAHQPPPATRNQPVTGKLDFQKFKAMSLVQKRDETRRLQLCYSCLSPGHMMANCTKRKPCGTRGCTMEHHYLLHQPPRLTNNNLAVIKPGPLGTGLLPVSKIWLEGPAGRSLQTYALHDTGSTESWIDETLAEQLGLRDQGPERHLMMTSFNSEEPVR
jgi:hypothetical protein